MTSTTTTPVQAFILGASRETTASELIRQGAARGLKFSSAYVYYLRNGGAKKSVTSKKAGGGGAPRKRVVKATRTTTPAAHSPTLGDVVGALKLLRGANLITRDQAVDIVGKVLGPLS